MTLSVAVGLARNEGKTSSIKCPSHDDKSPSLSVMPPAIGDDWLRIKCHGGCSTDQILSAGKLSRKDLAPPKTVVLKPALGPIVKAYDYVDETGRLLFQVCRYEPKDFRQRRPNGTGGWIPKIEGVRKVLFYLPAIMVSVANGETIYVVEGERDVESLVLEGLAATCNSGGAGKWLPAYTETLRGADVIVVPDNDVAGAKHLEVVGHALQGAVNRLRVLRLPSTHNGRPVKDATDFFSAGGTLGEFTHQVSGALDWQPAQAMTVEAEVVLKIEGFQLPKSDDDFSQGFLNENADRLRYCPDLKAWFGFDPKMGWSRDETDQTYSSLLKFARDTVLKGLQTAAQLENGAAFTRELFRLKDRRRLDPALELSGKDPRVVTRAGSFDIKPHLIGCLNGTINVLSGEFISFERSDLITRRLSVAYDPRATSATWERFLFEVQPDPVIRTFLQRLWGSALFGAIREHVLPFHYGSGANGKSTALEGLLDLFGSYGAKLTNSLVYLTRNGSAPTLELAGLFGNRFTLGEENSQSGQLNEELLKAITGGDRVKGRFHYSNFIEAPATYKVHLVGNHKPKISGCDDGIWRRFILVPWSVQIPAEQRDLRLRDKLRAESSGILNWLLAGCIEWDQEGLEIPEACKAVTNEFRAESDELADFIGERLEKNLNAYCLKADVYGEYKRWSDLSGIRPVTKRALSLALQERGFEGARSQPSRNHSWIGYALKPQ